MIDYRTHLPTDQGQPTYVPYPYRPHKMGVGRLDLVSNLLFISEHNQYNPQKHDAEYDLLVSD